MQAIQNALWGAPEYEPIPQLNDTDDNDQFIRISDLQNTQQTPSHLKLGNNMNTLATTSPTPRESDTTVCQDCSTSMTLTKTERFVGFIVLFIIGWFLALSTLANYQNLFNNSMEFTIWYSVGNIIALCSNFFLYGPTRQLVLMFSSNHRPFTIFYLSTIIASLFIVFRYERHLNLVVFAVCLQILASIGFTLSFLLAGVFGKAMWWLFGQISEGDGALGE